MNHTLTLEDRRLSSGEQEAVDDVPPKMTDWWADFGLGERSSKHASPEIGQRVETSGLFFMKELAEDLKRQPKPMAHVEAPKTTHLPMLPATVLPTDATLAASDRSVWTIPALLALMVLVALVSALGTLLITGRGEQVQPAITSAASHTSTGNAAMNHGVVPPTLEPATRLGAPPPAPPMSPTPVVAVVAPPPAEQPAVAPAVDEDNEGARKKKRRKKRSRRNRDRDDDDNDDDDDDDDKAAPAKPGYSLYATLGAVGAAKPKSAAPKSGGVATEAVTPAAPAAMARPKPRANVTYKMLKDAAGGERNKPAARPALPARIPASAVSRALGRIRGGVQACLRRFGFGHATIRLRVTVAGATGRVSGARVQGRFSSTPAGRCALRRVRSLRFPRFSRTNQTVVLPVRAH